VCERGKAHMAKKQMLQGTPAWSGMVEREEGLV